MFQPLLTVRADGADPPPPYGQPDRKISAFFDTSPIMGGIKKTKWKFKMEFSIKRRTPPPPLLMDIISIHFLPVFFFSFCFLKYFP